jgi:hypothetical protein
MEDSKQNKIVLLRQLIESAERSIVGAKQILSQLDGGTKKATKGHDNVSQVIEGVFDGEKMDGLDGRKYPVPANYASKSKLIEGDLLKLTITGDGLFIYKQVSPAERRKIIGTVMVDEKGKYYVLSEGRKYKVLLASITYFKAKKGDEVAIVVPKEKISNWAAIEAVLENSKENPPKENPDNLSNVGSVKQEVLDSDNKKEAESKKGSACCEDKKGEIIEDEWTPSVEEIRKETQDDKDKNKDSEVSDDLSLGNN